MTMHQLSNFVQLARVSFPFLNIYRARSLFRKEQGTYYHFWNKLVQNVPEINQLDGPLQRRIQHYLFANSMTTQWFSTLHGYKPNNTEKEAGWYIAAATPIADYLIDKLKYSFDDIVQILDGNSLDTFHSILHKLHRLSLSLNAHPNLFDKYLDLTLKSQAKSLTQSNGISDLSALKKITWDKGGYALILFRTALHKSISTDEERAIFQLGGLMQLHNDIFDLYRDIQEGIATIPSTTSDISLLSELYSDEIQKTIRFFNKLAVLSSSRKQFFLLLMLAINTGYICLDQYAALQKTSGGIFQPSIYSRQHLVCDMDSLSKISLTVKKTLNGRFG